jgi:hypothetical protein
MWRRFLDLVILKILLDPEGTTFMYLCSPSTIYELVWAKQGVIAKLLLFAIMLATLPFWAQIKNLRTRRREPHKLVSSGCKDIILSELKGYDEGLLEYVKI